MGVLWRNKKDSDKDHHRELDEVNERLDILEMKVDALARKANLEDKLYLIYRQQKDQKAC